MISGQGRKVGKYYTFVSPIPIFKQNNGIPTGRLAGFMWGCSFCFREQWLSFYQKIGGSSGEGVNGGVGGTQKYSSDLFMLGHMVVKR